MKARAAVRAVPVGGRTRCDVLRSDPPLTFRETSSGLSWIGTAAGPLGGDELALELAVETGAALEVGSVAASIALPGPVPGPSSTRIRGRVAAGAALRWCPQPVVLVEGCDHHAETELVVGVDAVVVWRDEVVLGRHEAPPGSLRQRLVVDLAGVPLLRTELAVGPRWPASLGPAGVDGCRAVGTLLLVNLPAPVPVSVPGVRLAVQPLAGPAVLVTAIAAKPGDLRGALDALTPQLATDPRHRCRGSVASSGLVER